MCNLFNFSEMESRNNLTMCRLCLGENECFINVFEMNDLHSYIAAEVITDLLHFQVSETDGYPHVVCSKCMVKLTDFKLFKECCQNSKVKYDNMFVSSESLEEHRPVMREFVTVRAEPIFYSDNEDNISKAIIKTEEGVINSSADEASEDPFKENETEVSCGPILLKYEVLPFSRGRHRQDEVMESRTSDYSPTTVHPASSSAEVITSDLITSEITIKEEVPEVKLALAETVTNPKYLQCLVNKRPHCISEGESDADSCTWSVSTNDQSIIEKSNNISLTENTEASSSETMEILHGKKILPGEGRYITPFYQQDLSIKKEVDKERRMVEEDIRGDGEAYRVTGPEKVVRGRREGLECFHCGIVLMSKHGLVQHMKVHGFVNSYECAECYKVFRFNCQLKSHVLSHTGSKPYKCAECSKSFRHKSHLNTHIRIHTGSKPYKCAECCKTFRLSSALKTHIRIHTGSKPYKCAVCSKCFSNRSYLKSHMRLHTGCKPYKCEECSERFTHNVSLKIHMISHTDSKPYKCAECSKSFTINAYLTRHMRIHSGSKPYKCEECSKCFAESHNLKIHMRTHSGSKPYKCTECTKSFTINCNLVTHMRTHTGYKPFKCAECNKRFSLNGNLKTHMRTHTGLKPYKCPKCNKSFSQNCTLKTHMSTHRK